MAWPFRHRGKWYVGYKNAHGERRRLATKARTKVEAQRVADDLERRAERQRLGLEPLPLEDGGEPLSDLLAWWLKTYSARSSTHERDGYILRRHLLDSELGRQRVERLTSAAVEAFLDAKAADLGPQSLNHLRGYLSRAYSAAIRTGRFWGANPIAKVKKRKVPKRLPDYLRAEEVPSVLAAVPVRWRGAFAAALYLGLRKGEVFGLRKADVDLKARTATVRHSHGRDTTKGGNVEVLPIARDLFPFLEAAIDASPSDLVFPHPSGGRHREDTDLCAILRSALRKADIVTGYLHVCRRPGCGHEENATDAAARRCPKHGRERGPKLWPKALVRPIRFHDLRHTTASLLVMAGVPMAAVQRILRHSDPRITSEVYSHLAPEYLRQEINRLSFGVEDLAPQPEALRAAASAVTRIVTTPQAPNKPPRGDNHERAAGYTTAKTQQESGCSVARPAGFEPATPGLEAAQRRVPGSGSDSQVGVTAGVRSPPNPTGSPGFGPIPNFQAPSKPPRSALTAIRGGAENLLTVRQVAERLSVSTATVYALCERGELAHVRVSNAIRVRPADLAALVARGGK